ncbi:MAG: hypothetical protein Q9186_004888 [Xanthomendoza sp. 1 TL-2023]
MVNYYKVLELPDNAAWNDIQDKYQQLLKSNISKFDKASIDHPLVETAHHVLCSPELRREYNKRLGLPAPPPTGSENEKIAGPLVSKARQNVDEDIDDDMDEINEQIRIAHEALIAESEEETPPRSQKR